MGKKTGLGDDPLSWIADTSKEDGARRKPREKQNKLQKFVTSEVPKFKTFEVKLSVLLRADQLESLERLAREIMANRDSNSRKERITKNTILRVYIDALKELGIDKTNISDESELLKRIEEQFSS